MATFHSSFSGMVFFNMELRLIALDYEGRVIGGTEVVIKRTNRPGRRHGLDLLKKIVTETDNRLFDAEAFEKFKEEIMSGLGIRE